MSCVALIFFLFLFVEFSLILKQKQLEEEVLHYKEQISALQRRLDSVTMVSKDECYDNKKIHAKIHGN